MQSGDEDGEPDEGNESKHGIQGPPKKLLPELFDLWIDA